LRRRESKFLVLKAAEVAAKLHDQREKMKARDNELTPPSITTPNSGMSSNAS